MVRDTPPDPLGPVDEELGPDSVVFWAVVGLADVVQERRREEFGFGTVAQGVFKNLQAVEQCVSFGMETRVLRHTVEILQPDEDFVVLSGHVKSRPGALFIGAEVGRGS